ncbi:hypothetical protein BKA66DRAFT_467291 [Pyrenochaeta sp. MPI-SDFR-AT-0127]|nr:hypothetical protein BKA66DRAFT_467291 [Pyrenochaeta sp. MPI-SDFR-AT-0127]
MGAKSKIVHDSGSFTSTSAHTPPSMPPPPYFKTHFINPNSFKAAINTKIDKPAVSLFRLSVRLLQFAFALASGISYAIELQHRNTSSTTNFIYAQAVFGITLLTLVVDSITVRYYRFIWTIEWMLAILWIACFGVFYQTYLKDDVKQDYQNANMGRMRRAVWCDLVNSLLWIGSAIFSSIMCCSGIKAAVKGKLEKRRRRKEKKVMMQEIGEMETGTVGVRAG